MSQMAFQFDLGMCVSMRILFKVREKRDQEQK